MKKYLPVILIALTSSIISVGIYHFVSGDKEVVIKEVLRENNIPVAEALLSVTPPNVPSFELAAERTVHGVVHITTEFERKSSVYDDFFDAFRDYMGSPHYNYKKQNRGALGMGSGVIISEDGYIVTNNHVVSGADYVEVTLNDKRSYEARVIGTDPTTDLALIKVDEVDLPFIPFGNSDDARVGEWVLAVGNPFNLTSTVTAGIVSAKARNIHILRNPNGSTIESFIQTDAAVNRGNSGGALVNTQGELIGINAAIATGTGYYAGYSFAIPVNIVKKVVNDLMLYGETQRGFIGVQILDVNSELADQVGLDTPGGVYIAGLMDGGSAEEAGIKDGDVILSVNSQPVNSTAELMESIGQHSPGDQVDVEVFRAGDRLHFPVVLKNQYGNTEVVQKEKEEYFPELGASFMRVSQEELEKLGLKNGVRVSDIEAGTLSRIGVRKNFIITQIDKERINDAKDIRKILNGKKGGVLIEGAYPNGLRAYYGMGIPGGR